MDVAATHYVATFRTGHVGVKYKNVMIVWGGYKEDAASQVIYLPSAHIWMYEPLLENWSVSKTTGFAPPGTSGACGVILEESLYIFGGYSNFLGNTNKLYRLNLETLEWALECDGNSVSIAVDKLVGWEHNKRLYYFGGFGSIDIKRNFDFTRVKDFTFCLDPGQPEYHQRGWNNQLISYNPIDKDWTCPKYNGFAPTARAAHAAIKVDNKVFIFGGRHLQYRLNDLHSLDMNTMTWSRIETNMTPIGRSWHSLTALNNDTLVLYGGFSQNNQPLGDCWLFDLKTSSWKERSMDPIRAVFWHSACMVLQGEILICGGCCGNILQRHDASSYSSDMFALTFTPKVLLRLCLDVISKNKRLAAESSKRIPGYLHNLISHRLNSLNSTTQRMHLTGS